MHLLPISTRRPQSNCRLSESIPIGRGSALLDPGDTKTMGARTKWIGVLALTAGLASAPPRKAAIVGGGDANRGKCTVEVVVDGTAQIEVRGDTATLRNAGGQAPQWRRRTRADRG